MYSPWDNSTRHYIFTVFMLNSTSSLTYLEDKQVSFIKTVFAHADLRVLYFYSFICISTHNSRLAEGQYLQLEGPAHIIFKNFSSSAWKTQQRSFEKISLAVCWSKQIKFLSNRIIWKYWWRIEITKLKKIDYIQAHHRLLKTFVMLCDSITKWLYSASSPHVLKFYSISIFILLSAFFSMYGHE